MELPLLNLHFEIKVFFPALKIAPPSLAVLLINDKLINCELAPSI